MLPFQPEAPKKLQDTISTGKCINSACDMLVSAKGKALVPTDLSVQLPPGTYGRMAPRSGLAVKHFIDIGAGVIDRDYRGSLGVVLFNFGENDFQVRRGDRIAQLVVEKIEMCEIKEVEELDESIRGANGYGSTGV